MYIGTFVNQPWLGLFKTGSRVLVVKAIIIIKSGLTEQNFLLESALFWTIFQLCLMLAFIDFLNLEIIELFFRAKSIKILFYYKSVLNNIKSYEAIFKRIVM